MTTLTDKEQTALNYLVRNNCCGATNQAYLLQDNVTWFGIDDLMEGLCMSRHEAAGIMSALNAKGLAADYEAGRAQRHDRDTWYVTDTGIRASDLPA